MNIIDKFYSDAIKIAKKSDKDFQTETIRLFTKAVSLQDKRLITLGDDFIDYWEKLYLSEELTKEEAIDWLYKILSFLDNNLEENMDFSQNDWKQINMILSANAENLDMDILNHLMMIIVDRKKI